MTERDATTASFEREFARAILALEKLRVTVLLATFFAVGLALAILFTLEESAFAGITRTQQSLRVVTLAALAAPLPFQLVLRRHVDRCIANDRPLGPGWRAAGVLFEVAVPSAVILTLSTGISASEALAAPPVIGYALIVLLSTLTMHVGQCVATGVAAGAAYLGLCAWFADEIAREFPGTLFSIWPPYIMRATMLVIAGVLAGVIAHQVRRRVVAALRSARDRDRAVDLFGQHVSPAVVDKLLSQPSELGPEVRRLCVMFVDIRDFTRFSAHRPPQEVVDYLNTLFAPLSETVDAHHGIINKFLGDGFMAVFGAPLDDPGAERHALAAARQILADVERLVAAGQIPPTVVGVGLHAGVAVTGTVGSARRKEYTIVGDTVNLAARIEQLNKVHGSRLLASDAVVAALGPDTGPCEPLPPATIRGRDEPLQLYRLA